MQDDAAQWTPLMELIIRMVPPWGDFWMSGRKAPERCHIAVVFTVAVSVQSSTLELRKCLLISSALSDSFHVTLSVLMIPALETRMSRIELCFEKSATSFRIASRVETSPGRTMSFPFPFDLDIVV